MAFPSCRGSSVLGTYLMQSLRRSGEGEGSNMCVGGRVVPKVKSTTDQNEEPKPGRRLRTKPSKQM